jgi:DNA-binding CsgD family transcriptional regulator
MQIVDDMVGFELGGIHSSAPGEHWRRGAEKGNTAVFLANNWRYMAEIELKEAQPLSEGFVLDTDVFSLRRRERLAIYQEFVVPNHLRSGLLRFWVMDGRVWIMALCRDRPTPYGRSVARLDLLFPYLRAAARAATWRANDDQFGNLLPDWGLTPTEEKIVPLVIRGLTNQEAAALLGLSPHTVRNSLAEIFRKLGVSRRSELAFLARGGVAIGGGGGMIRKYELDQQRRAISRFDLEAQR